MIASFRVRILLFWWGRWLATVIAVFLVLGDLWVLWLFWVFVGISTLGLM